MGFKEVVDLDCDTTTGIGGKNKKTGKMNPTKIEGYFIGSKETPSKKSKSGIAMLHILQTAKGNVGVWGKTDLDRKMLAVTRGCMIRIQANGTVPTPNGDMYKFKVEIDETNCIDVGDLPLSGTEAAAAEQDASGGEEQAADEGAEDDPEVGGDVDDTEGTEETPVDGEEAAADEVQPARPAPKKAVTPPAANQKKVQELLNKRRGAAK